ncbi:MAG: ABC transporter permease, partial [Phototrophicales bacterium]
MRTILDFLTRTRGKKRLTVSDAITYAYLMLGTLVMFGPIVWLVMSSFKPQAELSRFPPRFLPYRQDTAVVEGYDNPLPLFEVTFE